MSKVTGYPLFQAALQAELRRIDGKLILAREWRWHPTRRWRFDSAIPQLMIAIEIEGGVFVGGRHTRGAGYSRDLEKYREAAMAGWAVLRYTPDEVSSGKALREILAYVESVVADVHWHAWQKNPAKPLRTKSRQAMPLAAWTRSTSGADTPMS